MKKRQAIAYLARHLQSWPTKSKGDVRFSNSPPGWYWHCESGVFDLRPASIHRADRVRESDWSAHVRARRAHARLARVLLRIVVGVCILSALVVAIQSRAQSLRAQAGFFTTHMDNAGQNNDSELIGIQYGPWFYTHFVNSQSNATHGFGYDLRIQDQWLPPGWEFGIYLGGTYGYCGLGNEQLHGCNPQLQPLEAFHAGYGIAVPGTDFKAGLTATLGSAANTALFIEYGF